MAAQAQRPDVLESALTTALADRHDVVRLPERPAEFHAELLAPLVPGLTLALLPRELDGGTIQFAQSTNPLVPLEHLISQVPWVAPEPVLVDALRAAEGPPRRLDDLTAPAAERFT